MLKLVWLLATVAGAPVGVYVFPDPITTEACAAKVDAKAFTPDEQKIGEYISDKVGANLAVTPTCMTDAEVQDVLAKFQLQEDHSSVPDRSAAVQVRDYGQYDGEPDNVHKWFQNLMQPDNPYVSCCAEADGYISDSFEADGDQYVAIVTDGRGIVPDGTRIHVPDAKLKFDAGNPTGHGIIFLGPLSKTGGYQVYCYVVPGGV